jgi:hypothetical protein
VIKPINGKIGTKTQIFLTLGSKLIITNNPGCLGLVLTMNLPVQENPSPPKLGQLVCMSEVLSQVL